MKRDHRTVPAPLLAHLVNWLGEWPPAAPLHVVGTARRLERGWDGNVHPGLGIADPAHGAVLSVPPATVEAVRHQAAAGDPTAVLAQLPHLLGIPERGTYTAAFRWTTAPSPLPDIGHWLDADQAGVPAWLRPFAGQVLVVTDSDGAHLAGVGIKRHDRYGNELSVVTTPAARGQGLARALIAQAARRVLDEGAIPTYLYGHTNAASARVAKAAGFPDRGWTSFGISEAPTTRPNPPSTGRTGTRTSAAAGRRGSRAGEVVLVPTAGKCRRSALRRAGRLDRAGCRCQPTRTRYVGQLAAQIRRATAQPVRVVNLSVSGATVSDVVIQQLPLLGDMDADLVTVAIGRNDSIGYERARFAVDVDDLVAGLPQPP